jgi:hypothetical protein
MSDAATVNVAPTSKSGRRNLLVLVGGVLLAEMFVYPIVGGMLVGDGKPIKDSGASFGLDDVLHAVVIGLTVWLVEMIV